MREELSFPFPTSVYKQLRDSLYGGIPWGCGQEAEDGARITARSGGDCNYQCKVCHPWGNLCRSCGGRPRGLAGEPRSPFPTLIRGSELSQRSEEPAAHPSAGAGVLGGDAGRHGIGADDRAHRESAGAGLAAGESRPKKRRVAPERVGAALNTGFVRPGCWSVVALLM
ncbi:hypothetical protein NDU88_000974 [Pleurodeles waltl]|uniref:Uncharacterized protein n=1 Tax=Pleurodeles waltl TaxID=8319 RepID=A0AAV7NED8_PLEWA|nr:hypothetical protein NDU88_000974 [Pleurodeles waltl]